MDVAGARAMDRFVMAGPQHAPNAAWSFLIFTCAVGSVGGTIACLESVAGHSVPAAKVEHDVSMQSLQMLVSDCVYAVQKAPPPAPRNPFLLTAPPRETSNAARLVARIRDVRFDRGGRMAVLHVAPPVLPGSAEPDRLLPASAVVWDDSRRQWLVTEPNLQFSELEIVSDATPALQPSVLASQLLKAEIGALPAPEGGEPAAVTVPAESRVPTIWLAPGSQRLAVAVVPWVVRAAEPTEAETRYVPVPWSLVRAKPSDDGAILEIGTNPDALAKAPVCLDPQECPLAGLRQRSYDHFGVAAPAWDDHAVLASG